MIECDPLMYSRGGRSIDPLLLSSLYSFSKCNHACHYYDSSGLQVRWCNHPVR